MGSRDERPGYKKDGRQMNQRTTLRRALATAGVAAVTCLFVATDAVAATLPTVTTATGNAYGIKASGNVTALTLGLVPLNVPETPSVSTSNSPLTSTKTLASSYVPLACVLFTPTCAINAHATKVTTRNASGGNGSSVSSADLGDISLLFDLVNLKSVHADCRADKAGLTLSGSAVITPTLSLLALLAPGVALPSTSLPKANTVIPIGTGALAIATLTLNEQVDSSTGSRNSGEVNAVHLKVPAGSPLSLTGVDVVVGHAGCSAA